MYVDESLSKDIDAVVEQVVIDVETVCEDVEPESSTIANSPDTAIDVIEDIAQQANEAIRKIKELQLPTASDEDVFNSKYLPEDGDKPGDNAEPEEIEFIISKINSKRTDSEGTVEYNVEWEGYSANENTWEPVDNLVDCDRALKVFEVKRALALTNKLNKRLDSTSSGKDSDTSNSNNNNNNNSKSKIDLNRAGAKKVAKADSSGNGGVKSSKQKEFEVDEVIGMTMLEQERYFLLRLKDCGKPAFIRASLANAIIPGKIIDFYMAHIRWKPKRDDAMRSELNM